MSGGVETSNGDGPTSARDLRMLPDSLPALLSSSSYPITLKFIDLCYRVKLENGQQGSNLKRMFTYGSNTTSCNNQTSNGERTILNNITGIVSPGEILAVLGPSGSGKSTLLNALSGRLNNGHGFTGAILANNKNPTKQTSKRTGFVTQDDILYPHLTVRETLVFCSLLRLPNSITKYEKMAVADAVIAELGLTKCSNTIIGNAFIRGVSGGERKRVSIGHEMLINPSLLILDEPTSGLDSTAAYRLVTSLGALARKGKTIVTSMHQPSSRVYQMFDKVLVLSEGRCFYFGKGSDAMGYFQSVGFSPSFAMNPADFLLDLANGVCQVDGSSDIEKPSIKQTLFASYNTILAPKVKTSCMENNNISNVDHTTTEYKLSSTKNCTSTWLNQFTILFLRSLKERKHESFNALRVFQVIIAALLAGLMWWHSDYRDIQDRLGLFFFIAIFWGVFPSFNATFAFPQERSVFLKERASGMYTLSSYFMARITGDLPMELILPAIFLVVTYWMAGLKPDLIAFFLTMLVVLGYVLVSQGLGLALGAFMKDAKQASTLVTVTMLAFVLTGGFYVHNMPASMAWIKYVSTTYYCYKLLIHVQYGSGEKLETLLRCSRYGSHKASCKFIQEDVEGQINPAMSVAILFIMFVGYRLLAYLALRRIKA